MIDTKNLLEMYDNSSEEEKESLIERIMKLGNLMVSITGPKDLIDSMVRTANGDKNKLLWLCSQAWGMVEKTSDKSEIEFLLFVKTIIEDMIKERRDKELNKNDTKEI